MFAMYDYRTPISVFANIPIEHRYHPRVLAYLKRNPSRIRYRGPRPSSDYNTLKKDATAFSIYHKESTW